MFGRNNIPDKCMTVIIKVTCVKKTRHDLYHQWTHKLLSSWIHPDYIFLKSLLGSYHSLPKGGPSVRGGTRIFCGGQRGGSIFFQCSKGEGPEFFKDQRGGNQFFFSRYFAPLAQFLLKHVIPSLGERAKIYFIKPKRGAEFFP